MRVDLASRKSRPNKYHAILQRPLPTFVPYATDQVIDRSKERPPQPKGGDILARELNRGAFHFDPQRHCIDFPYSDRHFHDRRVNDFRQAVNEFVEEKVIPKHGQRIDPTFPISTSDMRFADLPVTNNQNLSALQSRNKCFSSYFG